jgi:general secretion pathway protein D
MRAPLASLLLVPALALAQVPIQPAPPTPGEQEDAPIRRDPNRTPPPTSPVPAPASPAQAPAAAPRPGPSRPVPVAPRPDAQRPAAPARPGAPARPPAAGARGAAAAPAAEPSDGTAETIRANGRCVPLEGRFMLSFNKADIVDVLEQASRWTCRNFMYTDDVARGKITLLSKTPVTAEEAYAAFLAALNANNVAVYPTGRYYKLHRLPDTKKNPIPTYVGDEGTPATEQPITKVIKLQYSDPDQLRGILGNFTSPQGADIQSIPPDTLVITDIGLNIRRIERLIDGIDRAGAGDLVRLVQIRFASAKDIADKVNQIFAAQGGGRTARRPVIAGTAGRPGQPAAAVPVPGAPTEVSLSKVIPDERTNKLIVIADEKSFDRLMELVEQLDVPTSGEGGIHVVFLKHANAEELAQTLSNLAQGQAKRSGTSGAPSGLPIPANLPAAQQRMQSQQQQGGEATAELFSGDVKLTADKTQNALLIQAGGADFLAIQRLIARLDRPRRQVFVEAVILEVNLRDENQFGVGAHGVVPFDYQGETGVIPISSQPGRVSSLNLQSAISLGGFLTGLSGPVSAELKNLGINLPSIGLLVQALQKSSDVNVLSTPHLLATDNEESEIAVGQNVPFQAGFAPPGVQQLLGGQDTSTAALGGLLVNQGLSSAYAPIQRQNVELRLKIKPQINEGGSVRLTIEEQVEEIVDRDPNLGPTTAKRSVKSQIVAKDQSTIVIGGLIQERGVKSVSKVPVLGSLPILGWLFRDTVDTKQKTNLLLFLTPYIIRDEADYRRIFERKRKEQQEFIEQYYGRLPKYEVAVDFTRKAGPYSRIRAAVKEESSRLENGGPGGPGEGFVTPPGAPRTGPQQPPPQGATPEGAEPPERLEVQPLPEAPPEPAPGTEPPQGGPPGQERPQE